MRSAVVVAVMLLASPARAQAGDGGAPAEPQPSLAQPTLPPLAEVDGGLAVVTLDDALRRALAQNPQLAGAVDEYRRSEALVREARAGWFPTLTGNASYTWLDGDRLIPSAVDGGAPTVSAAANQFNANAVLAVPVFAPKAWLGWDVAKQNSASQLATSEDTRRLVAVAVGRAYLTILAQHRILDADERAVSAALAHRDFAAARLQGGVGNRVDLVRAEQALQTEQALVENARTSLIRAQESLGVLLAEDRPLDVSGDPGLTAPLATPESAQGELQNRRRDLAALQVRAEAADQVVRNDWADFTPSITAAFQPFFNDPKSLTQPTTGWQATAALTWPLYDGGLRYGQQQERALLAHEAHLNEDAAVRQAQSDVRAAFAEVAHADAALVSARGAGKLAHEALELVNLSYHAGASTNIEVIDAERSALDADTQAVVAEDSARQARLDLLAATGRFPPGAP